MHRIEVKHLCHYSPGHNELIFGLDVPDILKCTMEMFGVYFGVLSLCYRYCYKLSMCLVHVWHPCYGATVCYYTSWPVTLRCHGAVWSFLLLRLYNKHFSQWQQSSQKCYIVMVSQSFQPMAAQLSVESCAAIGWKDCDSITTLE